jgi:signal transduction histidine kinase
VDLLPHLFTRTRAAGLPLTVTGQDQLDGVPVGVGLATYRIVQESLTNVVRHAGMAATTVSFSRSDAVLHLEVLNQPMKRSGTAQWSAAGQHPQKSNGVVGMRERARSQGGLFSAGPTAEGGYLVRAYLPCPAPSGRADHGDDAPASAGT